jgi:hypothetical protein
MQQAELGQIATGFFLGAAIVAHLLLWKSFMNRKMHGEMVLYSIVVLVLAMFMFSSRVASTRSKSPELDSPPPPAMENPSPGKESPGQEETALVRY